MVGEEESKLSKICDIWNNLITNSCYLQKRIGIKENIDLNYFGNLIKYFDYNNKNRDDDFLPLIRNILNNYDVLLFVTPVYWYSMSGVMKVFFDRITDVLDNRKSNKFKNKYMSVITSSAGDNLGEEFWIPFKKTAEYLGMKYLTDLHTIDHHIDDKRINQFIRKIQVEFN